MLCHHFRTQFAVCFLVWGFSLSLSLSRRAAAKAFSIIYSQRAWGVCWREREGTDPFRCTNKYIAKQIKNTHIPTYWTVTLVCSSDACCLRPVIAELNMRASSPPKRYRPPTITSAASTVDLSNLHKGIVLRISFLCCASSLVTTLLQKQRCSSSQTRRTASRSCGCFM